MAPKTQQFEVAYRRPQGIPAPSTPLTKEGEAFCRHLVSDRANWYDKGMVVDGRQGDNLYLPKSAKTSAQEFFDNANLPVTVWQSRKGDHLVVTPIAVANARAASRNNISTKTA